MLTVVIFACSIRSYSFCTSQNVEPLTSETVFQAAPMSQFCCKHGGFAIRFSARWSPHPFDYRPQLFQPFVNALKAAVNLADVLYDRFTLGTQRRDEHRDARADEVAERRADEEADGGGGSRAWRTRSIAAA
jgi:hypothetical protein